MARFFVNRSWLIILWFWCMIRFFIIAVVIISRRFFADDLVAISSVSLCWSWLIVRFFVVTVLVDRSWLIILGCWCMI